MKRFLLAVLLLACITFALNAQEPSAPKLYLEIEETGLPENSTVGSQIRVEVADASAAVVLKDELVSRFFAGKTYAAKLHTHRTDAPCTLIDL